MPTRLPRRRVDESSTSVPRRTARVITDAMKRILCPARCLLVSRPDAVLRLFSYGGRAPGDGIVTPPSPLQASAGQAVHGSVQHREAAGGTVMTRMRIAIAAALCFTASTVHAQNTHFIVSTPTASVYKAPTNVSPVVGEAKQGATLEVTRDVGSWVKVAWSNAPD